eukprot:1160815-Pelagomonas_calceolata.AAC.6
MAMASRLTCEERYRAKPSTQCRPSGISLDLRGKAPCQAKHTVSSQGVACMQGRGRSRCKVQRVHTLPRGLRVYPSARSCRECITMRFIALCKVLPENLYTVSWTQGLSLGARTCMVYAPGIVQVLRSVRVCTT